LQTQQLKRIARAASLRRYEESCRTVSDFENLTELHDLLDANRERKERYWEKFNTDILAESEIRNEAVIPPPLNHPLWRQLLSDDFLDVIFDCPHDIPELTSSRNVSELLGALDENHKEIMYYLAIRQWSPQKLAIYRGQTDRNIRKVNGKMIADLRAEMYERLRGRFERGDSLTVQQREFCENYKAVHADGE
jgi:hypothetical protein